MLLVLLLAVASLVVFLVPNEKDGQVYQPVNPEKTIELAESVTQSAETVKTVSLNTSRSVAVQKTLDRDKVLEVYDEQGLNEALRFLEEANFDRKNRQTALLMLLRIAGIKDFNAVAAMVNDVSMSQTHRSMVISNLMVNWKPSEEGYRWAEDNLEGRSKYDALSLSLQEIASENVELASELLDGYRDSPELYNRMLSNLLIGVSSNDIDGALDFISSAVLEKDRVSAFAMISTRLVEQDEVKAEHILRQHPDDAALLQLAHKLALKKFAQGPNDAVNFLMSLEEGPSKARAVRTTVFEWANVDPDGLKQFFDDASPAVQSEMAAAASKVYSLQSIDETSDWISSNSDESVRRKMFPGLLHELLKESEESAVEWAASLPNVEDKIFSMGLLEQWTSAGLEGRLARRKYIRADWEDGYYFQPNLYHQHNGKVHRH